MTGFLAALTAALRKRSSERPGVPFDELEEMARRAAAERRDFLQAVRRDRLAGDSFGPLKLLVSLAGADPAAEETFPKLDPGRIGAVAAEKGIAALAVYTEPDFYKGRVEWIPPLRSSAELPVLRLDWFLDPRAVLAALTEPVDALLLDPAILGRDSINETLALTREFGASGVVLLREPSDAEIALEESPPAVLIDRRDPGTLAIRTGMSDRIMEALEDYPGVRLVTGGVNSDRAVRAAAMRPFDGAILSKDSATTDGERLTSLVAAAAT
jgi:indole-3-glycerol phosphate synthase